MVTNERKTKGSYSVGIQTRDAILRAAMELIAQSGYYGLSLRDVARRVGISHPAVIYHFPSKEALMRAVVLHYEVVTGIYDVTLDPDTGDLVRKGFVPDGIVGILISLMRLSKHHESRTILSLSSLLTVEAANPEHPAHTHFVHRTEDLIRFVTEDIDRLRARGYIGSALTSRSLANALVAAWFGISIKCRYGDDEEVTSDAVASFLAETALVLRTPPEVQVRFGTLVPDDLADVYIRAMRLLQSMARESVLARDQLPPGSVDDKEEAGAE